MGYTESIGASPNMIAPFGRSFMSASYNRLHDIYITHSLSLIQPEHLQARGRKKNKKQEKQKKKRKKSADPWVGRSLSGGLLAAFLVSLALLEGVAISSLQFLCLLALAVVAAPRPLPPALRTAAAAAAAAFPTRETQRQGKPDERPKKKKKKVVEEAAEEEETKRQKKSNAVGISILDSKWGHIYKMDLHHP
ncbi:hypothetical protein TRV_01210 [Trichophyton verrucosum HKI 0517]|uniref:Uncharacterized protein n=1 Tax=Trichophyton verrucosum (strain HKI 0517) TaxID=663202 RepID=D4D2A7_TRIVH|nr:uncharacterized protein TRV_01210 [Trichophyton verrucosum HKI 0517]EFE44030.1 hypothetical protein TRV_01210 [Trichophyton verrucosum HKI 0517]